MGCCKIARCLKQLYKVFTTWWMPVCARIHKFQLDEPQRVRYTLHDEVMDFRPFFQRNTLYEWSATLATLHMTSTAASKQKLSWQAPLWKMFKLSFKAICNEWPMMMNLHLLSLPIVIGFLLWVLFFNNNNNNNNNNSSNSNNNKSKGKKTMLMLQILQCTFLSLSSITFFSLFHLSFVGLSSCLLTVVVLLHLKPFPVLFRPCSLLSNCLLQQLLLSLILLPSAKQMVPSSTYFLIPFLFAPLIDLLLASLFSWFLSWLLLFYISCQLHQPFNLSCLLHSHSPTCTFWSSPLPCYCFDVLSSPRLAMQFQKFLASCCDPSSLHAAAATCLCLLLSLPLLDSQVLAFSTSSCVLLFLSSLVFPSVIISFSCASFLPFRSSYVSFFVSWCLVPARPFFFSLTCLAVYCSFLAAYFCLLFSWFYFWCVVLVVSSLM